MFRKKVCIQGPLQEWDGKMVLAIPLDAGGRTLKRYSKGIGEVVHEHLVIEIQPWLAEKLNVQMGSLLVVDNLNGRLTITRSPDNDN